MLFTVSITFLQWHNYILIFLPVAAIKGTSELDWFCRKKGFLKFFSWLIFVALHSEDNPLLRQFVRLKKNILNSFRLCKVFNYNINQNDLWVSVKIEI